ncbi:MAG TPA: PDZ domain-containing protein [Pyrinomonadaceae bacterium]|nr:PDZ domain-containing protein [Pyrinomonadaceae bacterium]
MNRTSLFSAVCLLLAAAGLAAAQPATTQERGTGRVITTTLFGGGNFLGVTTENVTKETMGRYGLAGEPRGVAITSVAEGSPAAKAGLQKGDVLLRFDGEPVSSVQKLQRLISEAAPEQATRLTISRNGAEQEVSATLGRREEFPRLEGFTVRPGEDFKLYSDGLKNFGEGWQERSEDWQQHMDELRQHLERLPQGSNSFVLLGAGRRIGITTTPLTAQLADFFGVNGQSGVLVTAVAENSPAAKAGLKAGDVITEVDGERVSSSGDLVRALGRRNEGDVTLGLTRERKSRTVKVTPERAPQPSTFVMPEVPSVAFALPRINMPRINLRVPRVVTTPRILSAPRIIATPRLRVAPLRPTTMRRIVIL